MASSTAPFDPTRAAELQAEVKALVRQYMEFVWRSLRRLGVWDADCDDGCQRVWIVVAQKAGSIEPGKAKSFIFSVVVRIAAEMRRKARRPQHVELDEASSLGTLDEAEALYDRRAALRLLDELLEGMSFETRSVFIMFELEGFSTPEIAEALKLRRGTVASRLRLGREYFERALERRRLGSVAEASDYRASARLGALRTRREA